MSNFSVQPLAGGKEGTVWRLWSESAARSMVDGVMVQVDDGVWHVIHGQCSVVVMAYALRPM
jgi:hypothetical protein